MKVKSFVFLALVSLSAAIQVTVFAESTSDPSDNVTLNYPVLLTPCRVAEGEKYFKTGTILVLAFVVGSNSSYLYEHSNQQDKFLAEMHYDEGGLDAQGGVWSSIRARDVYNSLSKRKFILVTSAKDYQSNNYLDNLLPCRISYIGLSKYE